MYSFKRERSYCNNGEDKSKRSIKALEAWDIDHLYGIPGDSIDAVVDSLRTVRDSFKFYHVRHEEVASLAAASYTKMTGKIGVALSIGGPGIVHLLNGMYDAKMDRVLN